MQPFLLSIFDLRWIKNKFKSMYLRSKYLAICFLLIVGELNAQLNTLGDYNQLIVSNWAGEFVRIGPYQVKGSLYLFGESFPGTIHFQSGQKITNTKILYNVYHQIAGIDKGNEIFEMSDKVEEFTITLPEKYGSGNLVFKAADQYGKNNVKGYFNVLSEGKKMSLLKLFKCKLMPDPTNTLSKDTKIFEQYVEYYIYSPTSKALQKIKLKEKDILKSIVMDDHVKNIILQNKTDFSNETDIIRFFDQYNKDL